MKHKKTAGKILVLILIFILTLLSFSLQWCLNNFGNIGMNEIVFTLNMPLKGTSNEYFYTYFQKALCPSLFLSLLLMLLITVPGKSKYILSIKIGVKQFRVQIFPLKIKGYFLVPACMVWFIYLLISADSSFNIFSFIQGQLEASPFIENEYVDANEIDIIFPEAKRNLICIYVESAETSFQDKANGGLLDYNNIPEMTRLASENISFSQSELFEGAAVAPACGWTMAALVAQTAGLPLKLYEYDGIVTDNSMSDYASFMPGATSLGDILEANGYRNIFMSGSDFTFGGRRDYFTQHGNYEIWDYYTAIESDKIPEGYKVKWGFEDQKLYSYAKEKLLEAAATEQPFNFSMLTVDTHTGGGYICELCPDTYDNDYANVWACASSQLYEFVKWIKQQDFYENTTIYIAGDHSSMQPDFINDYDYDKHNGSTYRKVYNAFINSAVSPVNMKNREFTTMDLFPSVLASLGVSIEGNRIGLGTNLFSNEQTLAEKYGYQEMFDELNKVSTFYNQNILYPQ